MNFFMNDGFFKKLIVIRQSFKVIMVIFINNLQHLPGKIQINIK